MICSNDAQPSCGELLTVLLQNGIKYRNGTTLFCERSSVTNMGTTNIEEQWNPFIGTTVGTDRSGPIRGVVLLDFKIPLEYVGRDSGGLSVGRGGPIKGK